MRTPELIKVVQNLYRAGDRQAVLMLGQPGIGKTDAAKEIANGLNLNFLAVDLSIIEPVDLMGLPNPSKEAFNYLPNSSLHKFVNNPGVIFLDEITNVERSDVLSAALRLVLERKVGLHTLHPDCIVFAAGNTPDNSSLANLLPAPLLNRFTVLTAEPPTLDEWIDHMNEVEGESWDYRIAGFLKQFPQFFVEKPTNETQDQYSTPRSWTKLAKITKRIKLDIEVLEGRIGKRAANHLQIFLTSFIPTLDEVLKDMDKEWGKYEVTQKYLISAQAAQAAQRKDNKTKLFLEKLAGIPDKEFVMVTTSMIPKRILLVLAKKWISEKNPIVDTFKNIYKMTLDLDVASSSSTT